MRKMRFILNFALVCALLLTMAIPTLAAGTEDWANTSKTYVGSMHLTNNTLSPVKTIKKAGTLHIEGRFYGEDQDADISPIKLTAEIRNTSGTTLASTVRTDDRSGFVNFSMSCPVSYGQQVRIYFDASSISNPPGYYRKAYIEYWYYIS